MSTPKSKIVIGPEHVLTMIDAINHLFNETGRLFNQYQNEPHLDRLRLEKWRVSRAQIRESTIEET